jgi:hypothetical protein
MPSLIDALRIAALLLVSAGVCGCVLVLAARFGLDRLWRTTRTTPLESLITNLADIADFAVSGGLISIAAPAAALHQPLLSRGINLLIEGQPIQTVRQTLHEELDKSILHAVKPASILLACTSMLGLLTALVACILLATSGSPTEPLLLAAAFILPGAIALAAHTTMHDRAAISAPERALRGMFAIEAVCLISSRRDGQAVRNYLRALLPGPAPVAVSAAA